MTRRDKLILYPVLIGLYALTLHHCIAVAPDLGAVVGLH
jgi:hypothetical protein